MYMSCAVLGSMGLSKATAVGCCWTVLPGTAEAVVQQQRIFALAAGSHVAG